MSELGGIVPEASSALRVAFVNAACDLIGPAAVRDIVCSILYLRPDPDNWSGYPNVYNEIHEYIEKCKSGKVFKCVESVYVHLVDRDPEDAFSFESKMNECLEDEQSKYVILDGAVKIKNDSPAKPRRFIVKKQPSEVPTVPETAAPPAVFIGSSKEGLQIANAIQSNLHRSCGAFPKVWDQGVFGLGSTVIDSLLEAPSDYDFAVFVLSADDMITSREQNMRSPRDNVIFELGLFMGRLGRRRTFVLFEKRADLKLLSDLSGLILATYDGVWALKDVESAIAEACSPIRAAIKNQGKFDDDLPSAANWTILCDR